MYQILIIIQPCSVSESNESLSFMDSDISETDFSDNVSGFSSFLLLSQNSDDLVLDGICS